MDKPPQGRRATHPLLHKVVSIIYTPTTTYFFCHFQPTGTTVNQVTDEVLYTGLIEMQNHPVPTSRSGLLLNPNPGFLCIEGRPLGWAWVLHQPLHLDKGCF